MRIMVRAYAAYREAIGAPAVSVEVPEGATPQQVWAHLVARFPELQRLPPPHRFAVNEEYVPGARALRERDELVLLPPVSGGRQSEERGTDGPLTLALSPRGRGEWMSPCQRGQSPHLPGDSPPHPDPLPGPHPLPLTPPSPQRGEG